MEFSVLMSVYKNENHKYFYEAIQSTVENQSVIPNELVIVKDGPLTDELEKVIKTFEIKFPSILKVVQLENNVGLGEALRIGLEHCNFDIVARMDSDDINHFLRFEKQLKVLKNDNQIDVVGTYIGEFFNSPSNLEFIRTVPIHSHEIKKMSKRRNPINHVSVMFKKDSVKKVGSYKHLYFLEDYYLWVRMINEGLNLINIDETLVYVRTGNSMFKRRSNPQYISSWFLLQKEMYKNGLITKIDFLINMLNIIVFIGIPPKLKELLYRHVLRSNPR
ncbi:glycosyltransferase [Neobacillus cucumis]|uniref:glycosyltransferase n=1 Tax=Neobacillus cucumis TaxID=1740721 RepID=UPI0018E0237D|nr:glycosyltransferase [Neobacillus cucumis]MBI0577960.1 glycosyltransferase [Neobacillus cucumis]